MDITANLQNIIKNLVNGTLEQNLCRICLLPLEDLWEDIFTTICKKDKEYCIADILEEVCCIKLNHTDQYRVCPECFTSASEAYKFYLKSRRSEEILSFYVNEMNQQINSINTTSESAESVCFTLPVVSPDTYDYDFDISKFPYKNRQKTDLLEKECYECKPKMELDDVDDKIIIVMNENGEQTFYKLDENGSLQLIDNDSKDNMEKHIKQEPENQEKKKRKRKRNPMSYKMCSQCPVRYRFVRKLKEHMKQEHGIDLFVCKVCQALIEDEQEFNNHLQTHTGIHTCAICNMIFKKRETIIAHFKWHEEMNNLSKQDGAHVCEICGLVLKSEEHLKEHNEKKHVKKYTCYYCGKMYKGEISFELHLKKHEDNNDVKQQQEKPKPSPSTKRKRRHTCAQCGRDFVDERALLWHGRLHTDERPYVCDVCGRGFVSLNRRNQHALCAHTAPARRCPLCPALFHLRSCVNTHVKKVHLKAHKRRNRTSKHQNVFWKTETVPIQELSVSIQNEILELKAAQTRSEEKPLW